MFIALDGDSVGSGTVTATALTVTLNGLAVVRLHDPVTTHGDPPHAAATMAEASSSVFAEGVAVCRIGDKASCGHALVASEGRPVPPDATAG
ncbi:MAG: PAAR domain-containing protein [Casimicrobiaceae bacterium]